MNRFRRTGLVLCCCFVLVTVGPIAGAAQRSPAAASQSPIAGQSPAASQTEFDGGAQPASACFGGAGTEFVIGSANETHIWIRLHAGPLTDSGWALGGELIGSTGGNSIVEVIAGVQFVGDGFLDLLSSPAESVELISGFDFQLPMLEGMTGEFTESGAMEHNESSAEDSSTGNGSTDGGEAPDDRDDDSRFEMLRC